MPNYLGGMTDADLMARQAAAKAQADKYAKEAGGTASSVLSALGGVAGGIGGAFVGGPAGIIPGMSIGSSLGGAAGDVVTGNPEASVPKLGSAIQGIAGFETTDDRAKKSAFTAKKV